MKKNAARGACGICEELLLAPYLVALEHIELCAKGLIVILKGGDGSLALLQLHVEHVHGILR